MDLKKIIIDNFLTISHAELELDNRGLLLIQGENDDDTSANSNGAGKSSIVDAICWGLYGETARGASGDIVVNRAAKKECSVDQVWSDGDMEYRITRYRKHSTGKNMVGVKEYDLKTGAENDLTKGTDRETQAVIEKILGCSLDVFKGSIYAGQEAMPDLPGMTDKNLKLLIEEAAGVEILADAYREANARALAADREYNTAAAHVKSLQGTLDGMRERLKESQTEHASFEAERKARARDELKDVPTYEAQIGTAKDRLAGIDETALAARRAALQADLTGHKTLTDRLATLQVAERNADRDATRLLGEVEAQKRDLAARQTGLANVEALVGTPCGECGKPYHEHDLDTARAAKQKAIDDAKTTLLKTAGLAKAAVAAHNAAKQAVADFAATIPDVSAVAAEQAEIDERLLTAKKLIGAIEARENAIASVKNAARARLTEPNPWAKVIETKQADITKLEKDLDDAAIYASGKEDEARLMEEAAKVFGPAGVRAHILDTVTPFLNERTSEYLGALADGNITATWSTLAKNSKGELKEKFNIDVTHAKGGDNFKLLSGGEKRKVRLATNLALQDMVASRAEKPINLWLGDEIDDALDEAGLERLIGVLEKKAKERGTVMVISHKSLKDWIDSVINVKKSGGVSEITGATHKGL
jgi:DNA repair exonuclease SbcCD ATPase subunit